MSTHLVSIGTAVPEYSLTQAQVAQFMGDALRLEGNERRKLKTVYERSGIATRHTVLADYTRTVGQFEFFPNTEGLQPAPGTAARMAVYQQAAPALALEAIENCIQGLTDFDRQRITHLIVVSCTGMYAPGLDIDLVQRLGLPSSVERTAINFMGCYAAFNALKLAHYALAAQPDAVALVVCVELCTLHFQTQWDDDNLISNALFADGAAAALLMNEPTAASSLHPLQLTQFYAEFAPAGRKDMAWVVGDIGFEIHLSSYVPALVQAGLKDLADKLRTRSGGAPFHHYAIHPGGQKILEAAGTALSINREAMAESYSVMRDYGNMSSATILFVLQRWMQKLNSDNSGERLLACAFGPGLTMETLAATVA